MRVRCERSSREMGDFTALPNLNQGNHSSEKKMELVKMFVEFLESRKFGHDHKMHKHGRHEMFGRFEKHGHGRHHGRRPPFGHHEHHHGHQGLHYRGPHGHSGPPHCGPYHHGPRGPHHRGPHGPHRHGPHGHYHHQGRHGHCGKFKAQWIIDLTEDDEQPNHSRCVVESVCITSNANEENASTSNAQEGTAEANNMICECSRFRRRHCGRRRSCCDKSNENATKDNPAQANEPMNAENIEEPQESLTTMVENINMEN